MKKLFLIALASGLSMPSGDAQNIPVDSAVLKIYRSTPPKINELVHTKLDLSFDYNKCYAYGKAWITCKPHGFATDTLTLDARGMRIDSVCLVGKKTMSALNYRYDGSALRIQLGQSYAPGTPYTIYVRYVARPNEVSNMSRGLYFINPRGLEKNKPTQIWTQGFANQTSTWCPTLDKPNQKSTQEFILTVPDRYITMSNGKLLSQRKNNDGTRTDQWKMDLPNAPYLFFIGVGDYAIVKDHYKNIDVDYYVEKEYGKYARRTYGATPSMIAYFEKKLEVPYPWAKYDQITAHDLPSSMENTSCTLHGYSAQLDARDLSEGTGYETTICHELFHQWFGDLVTTESWSNLTLNESFANLSETLWTTYREGRDAGDAVNYWAMMGYLSDSAAATKDLVRFHYTFEGEMLDYSVTYNKGGRILNMLRYYLGDSIFFQSLKLYLTTHQYKNAEIHDLRLAFEEVSGQDLNWYWNQWYFGSGHPKLTIDYSYNDSAGKACVIIRQIQHTGKIFRIPITIDVYAGLNKKRYSVNIEHETDCFYFTYKHRPPLINVDGEKIILCEKQDNKTFDNFIYQYKYAGSFLDRLETIDYCARHQDDQAAVAFLRVSINDRFGGLRRYTIEKLDMSKDSIRAVFEPLLVQVAVKDPFPGARGAAFQTLGALKKEQYKDLFIQGSKDSSYFVAGSALEAISGIDSGAATGLAITYGLDPAKGKLAEVLFSILVKTGNPAYANQINNVFRLSSIYQQFAELTPLIKYLPVIKDDELFKESVDFIVNIRDLIPAQFFEDLIKYIKGELKTVADQKTKEGLNEQAIYINSKL